MYSITPINGKIESLLYGFPVYKKKSKTDLLFAGNNILKFVVQKGYDQKEYAQS